MADTTENTNADVNSSINNLIGTFATINTGSSEPIPDKLVCIDTLNNRIGINTVDPSYSLHVVGNTNDGTIACGQLIISHDITNKTKVILKNLPTFNTQGEVNDANPQLEDGQLYKLGGDLSIFSSN